MHLNQISCSNLIKAHLNEIFNTTTDKIDFHRISNSETGREVIDNLEITIKEIR